MRYQILLISVLALGACGGGSEAEGPKKSSASSSPSMKVKESNSSIGLVSFKALSKQTVNLPNGITSECHVIFDVQNGLGSDISRACVKYDINPTDSAFTSAIKIAGTQKVCGRNMNKRDRKEVKEKIPNVTCEDIESLQVVGFECFDDAEKCTSEAFEINGGDTISLEK